MGLEDKVEIKVKDLAEKFNGDYIIRMDRQEIWKFQDGKLVVVNGQPEVILEIYKQYLALAYGSKGKNERN
jgi:hypothetical protein